MVEKGSDPGLARRMVGKLMAQAVLGEAPEMPLFPIDRLLERQAA